MSRIFSGRAHLVLVSSSLGGGGAERVMMTMAEAWVRGGHAVTIVTLRADEAGHEYELPAGVALRRLGIIEERNPFWRPVQLHRMLVLRRELRAVRPSVVISFIDKLNVAVLLALVGTNIPVVATEHLVPWMNPLGLGWEMLRRIAYRRAVAVVSPTGAITDWFKQRVSGVFVTLPYPASVADIASTKTVPRCKLIVGVGRLAPEKGFDLLVEAFAGVASKWPEWNVDIVGAGPERATLERHVERHGLRSRIRLVGHVTDVAERLSGAAVYVLCSRHEAYPMALCEALAAGCCVVATDCPTGPREIFAMAGEEVGVLIPPGDPHGLADAMERVMRDTSMRERLGHAAQRCSPRFGPVSVMKRWDAFLESTFSVSG